MKTAIILFGVVGVGVASWLIYKHFNPALTPTQKIAESKKNQTLQVTSPVIPKQNSAPSKNK